MIKVFNADDHPMLRKGVSDLIVQTNELKWVGSASNGKEAIEKIRNLRPEVAVLDIEMPQYSGLEVAQILMEEGSDCQFVLLTLFKDETFFKNALKLGIKGYLLKESSEKEIIDCIKSVAEGKPYVNPSLTHFLIGGDDESHDALKNLTPHEVNILKLIAKQKTSTEIADMLFISPKTVGNHRSNISKKLGLDGKQNGLLKWAMEQKTLLG